MNRIFEYGSISAIPQYNCSAHSPLEWSLKDGVPRPISGIVSFGYGIIIIVIYTPMLVVMLEKENFQLSCFKIMALLTIIDISSIIINSLITGYLSYQGAVYCSNPILIYISGALGLGLWCCACLTALILVVNRLLDLLCPRVGEWFFDAHRTFYVLFVPVAYGLYYVFFTCPILFTSKFVTWFFDPLIFDGMAEEYINVPHFYNNVLVVAITGFLYVFFCCALGAKVKNVEVSSRSKNMSLQIFSQSAMICLINQMAAIIYVTMNYIEIPFWLIILGQVAWQLGHGAPAIIYLVFNKTLRNGVLRKIGFKKTKLTSSKVTNQASSAINLS